MDLRTAATLFAGATMFGAVVSIRDRTPGEPLGIRLPGSVPVHLVTGWGSGVSAPWPMPVAAVIAARRPRPGDTAARQVCVGLGLLTIAGTLVEPVTWGRRPGSRAAAAAIALNLAAGVALVVAGSQSTSEE